MSFDLWRWSNGKQSSWGFANAKNHYNGGRMSNQHYGNDGIGGDYGHGVNRYGGGGSCHYGQRQHDPYAQGFGDMGGGY